MTREEIEAKAAAMTAEVNEAIADAALKVKAALPDNRAMLRALDKMAEASMWAEMSAFSWAIDERDSLGNQPPTE